MKTMTCKQLGGTCDTKISAETSADMAQKMTAHVMSAHPDVAQKFSTMNESQHEDWEKEFHKNWDAAPVTGK
jgi:predicted small metal-binding protein